MSQADIINYYPRLLPLQYVGKPRAFGTVQTQVTPVVMPQTSVQTITFPEIPDAGAFALSWEDTTSEPINWNDSTAVVQAKIRDMAVGADDGGDAFTTLFVDEDNGGAATTVVFADEDDGGTAFGFGGAGTITVTGTIGGGLLTVTFTGILPPVDLLELLSTTLMAGPDLVTPVIAETTTTLPLAVQAGYDLDTAAGVQLDVLGKYLGVQRTGRGFATTVTLSDEDFRTLIKMALVRNSSQSDLSTIVGLLFRFFAAEILAYDHEHMRMSFVVAETLGGDNLLELFITEGLLPVPMAVQYVLVRAPVGGNYFSFRTYRHVSTGSPFNSYSDYQTNRPWLTYADAVTP